MKRIATALVGIPLAVLITIYSPDWLFALFVAGFGALCFDELLTFSASRTGGHPGRGVVLMGALVTVSFVWGPAWVAGALAAAMITSMIAITLQGPIESALSRAGVAALGILYC